MLDKRMERAGMVAGVLAVAVFILAFVLLDLGFLISIIATAGSLFGAFFIFEGKKPQEIAKEDALNSALEAAEKKLASIRNLARHIRKGTMLVTLKGLDDTGEKILAAIRKDPNKLRSGQQFLDYYLDSTEKIINKYVELSSQGSSSAGIRSSLLKVETTMNTVKDTFDAQLAKILSNDVMDLDVAIQTLEQISKADQ